MLHRNQRWNPEARLSTPPSRPEIAQTQIQRAWPTAEGTDTSKRQSSRVPCSPLLRSNVVRHKARPGRLEPIRNTGPWSTIVRVHCLVAWTKTVLEKTLGALGNSHAGRPRFQSVAGWGGETPTPILVFEHMGPVAPETKHYTASSENTLEGAGHLRSRLK